MSSSLGVRTPEIVPKNIFQNEDNDDLKDLLPDFQTHFFGAFFQSNLRAIESRFYVDLTTGPTGSLMARRRLTAIVVDPDGTPVAGRKIEWSRERGSAALRFAAADGSFKTELRGADSTTTGADGMSEITIAHPPSEVVDDDIELVIKAEIDIGRIARCSIFVARNRWVPEIDGIARKTEMTANHIWVFQPQADQREATPLNTGIRDLQEMLNEVVSRHRGVSPFDFIPLTGVFEETTRAAVQTYITKFKTIKADADYPYSLDKTGISEHLAQYVKDEYAPFDPGATANQGAIVDRHLLVGEKWDVAPAAIDGLAELYESAVQQLRNEMLRVANEYLQRATFWLHRTDYLPYTAATDSVFRMKAAATLRTQSNASSNLVLDANGDAAQCDIYNTVSWVSLRKRFESDPGPISPPQFATDPVVQSGRQ